jgi:hypothetical protein
MGEAITTYSQACQDTFVESALKQKRDGFFVEIGSNHPITHNNTYLLESVYGWKGLMVEYDSSFAPLYRAHRPRSLHQINDARSVDYKRILDVNLFPKNIDYLQVDLDVNNRSTLDTLLLLNSTVFPEYTFATVTFEHDIYSGNFFDTRRISREIFARRGYELVFPDVSVYWQGGYKPFEDWYVHPTLVDMEHINKIKSSESMNVDEIRQRLRL